jgi:L-threonylcarbamoyladenylate synthase
MTNLKLHKARIILQNSGVIAYPTEGVYGLGCDPDCEPAVMKILTLKQRKWQQGLILIAADIRQLQPYLAPLNAEILQPVLESWAQQQVITWLLPARVGTPKWLTGESHKLAVRVTHHPLARELCQVWGKPLVSTSANRSGCAPARNNLQVRLQLGRELDYIISGEVGTLNKPSQIRDAITQQIFRA